MWSSGNNAGADQPALRLRISAWFAGASLGAGCIVALGYLVLGGRRIDVLSATTITTGLICLSLILLARFIAGPVKAATATLRRFAAGETDLRLNAERGTGHFRRLAAVVNALAARVQDRELQYALVSEATGDVIWKWDGATDRVSWTGELRSLFGLQADHFEADSDWWHGRVHPKEREEIERRLSTVMEGTNRHWSEEYRFRHEDGSYRWFWDRGVIVRDACGKPALFVGCMTDISDQRAAEERVWQLANNDELTGLANRKVFHAELDSLLEASAAACGAVLLVDIDQFKDVNDSLGHAAGDALLKAVGNRLKESVGERGTVYRLGGDEFAVLLPGYDDDRSTRLATHALAGIRAPMEVAGRNLNARATIGVATFPRHGGTAAVVLQNADLALYEGKEHGRDQVVCFVPSMRAALEQRISLLRQVRQGIADRRFEPYYQPIVSLKDGSLRGVEALMRWHHPETGLLTPGSFFAAYEDPGVALELGDRLLERVIADFCMLDGDGLAPPYIAINVSSTVSRLSDFARQLIATLAQAGMPPSRLAIELTETLLFGDHAESIGSTVRDLHDAGIRIALDDFGTGYASLTHLRKFPVDAIKIDQSFVQSIATDADAQAIVSALLELGRRLGKDVIAEGVETAEHATLLRAAGCRQAQGFYFARPMPASALRDYILAERSGIERRIRA
jgi:diguanylate cyclase (GGDEF)-like protein/PAS domain S-box-containing protein